MKRKTLCRKGTLACKDHNQRNFDADTVFLKESINIEAKTFNTFNNYFWDAALQTKADVTILQMKHNQSRGGDHKHTKRTNEKKTFLESKYRAER